MKANSDNASVAGYMRKRTKIQSRTDLKESDAQTEDTVYSYMLESGGGVLVRKLSQLPLSAKLSWLTPGISSCSEELAVS